MYLLKFTIKSLLNLLLQIFYTIFKNTISSNCVILHNISLDTDFVENLKGIPSSTASSLLLKSST